MNVFPTCTRYSSCCIFTFKDYFEVLYFVLFNLFLEFFFFNLVLKGLKKSVTWLHVTERENLPCGNEPALCLHCIAKNFALNPRETMQAEEALLETSVPCVHISPWWVSSQSLLSLLVTGHSWVSNFHGYSWNNINWGSTYDWLSFVESQSAMLLANVRRL